MAECVWIWRGRVKSRWESLGFDSGMFDLFIRMRGARTRLGLLDALSRPMDRLQLAQALGVDWKVVDHNVVLLYKYGLIREESALGRTRVFRLTAFGESFLGLLREFDGDSSQQ